ncbi:MAG: lysylphosphatidylglycerol synthase transmembrane domain-containing protein [Gaiellaceae bacterium]
MSAVAPEAPAVVEEKGRFRPKRILVGALVVVVLGAAANMFGWDLRGWFSNLWDTLSSISLAYIVAGCALKTVQTSLTAYAWYAILHFAYPGRVRWREILACYAASVALNGFLPANIGTLVMLLMFTTIIAGATFVAILGAYAVQKIFFTLIGVFVYLYLFLSVSGSFDIKFAFVHEHPWGTAICLLGSAYILFLLLRRLWPRVLKWWEQAKDGGAILSRPRTYIVRVFTPSLLAWFASLGVMAVFLAAYDIPVSFDTLMRIAGGNSIANVTSVTPGGAGVNQAFNVASLNGVTDATTATAYSVAQQLVTTAWNMIFAMIVLVFAFGWTGGKALLGSSYSDAKEKAAEQKAARDERKRAKKDAEPEAV